MVDERGTRRIVYLVELGPSFLSFSYSQDKSGEDYSKEFEQMAMNREFSSHVDATPELRSMLYCLLDYWEVDRVMFSASLKEG